MHERLTPFAFSTRSRETGWTRTRRDAALARRGHPGGRVEASSLHLFRGELVVEVYEAAPGKFQIVAPYDEFIHILDGELILVAEDGERFEYKAGNWVMLPKGWTGTWENRGNYRELIAAERKSWEASASATGASHE